VRRAVLSPSRESLPDSMIILIQHKLSLFFIGEHKKESVQEFASIGQTLNEMSSILFQKNTNKKKKQGWKGVLVLPNTKDMTRFTKGVWLNLQSN